MPGEAWSPQREDDERTDATCSMPRLHPERGQARPKGRKQGRECVRIWLATMRGGWWRNDLISGARSRIWACHPWTHGKWEKKGARASLGACQKGVWEGEESCNKPWHRLERDKGCSKACPSFLPKTCMWSLSLRLQEQPANRGTVVAARVDQRGLGMQVGVQAKAFHRWSKTRERDEWCSCQRMTWPVLLLSKQGKAKELAKGSHVVGQELMQVVLRPKRGAWWWSNKRIVWYGEGHGSARVISWHGRLISWACQD
jgi:hypothetical protein